MAITQPSKACLALKEYQSNPQEKPKKSENIYLKKWELCILKQVGGISPPPSTWWVIGPKIEETLHAYTESDGQKLLLCINEFKT